MRRVPLKLYLTVHRLSFHLKFAASLTLELQTGTPLNRQIECRPQ